MANNDSQVISFLGVNHISRSTPRGVDWTDGSPFAGPLVIYMFFGACC